MEPNLGFLTNLLSIISQGITLGYATVAGEAVNLLTYLITIEFILIFAWGALSGNVLADFVIRLIPIGIVIWIVNNFSYLANLVSDTFIQIGMMAGGSNNAPFSFDDPSAIIEIGIQTVEPIGVYISDISIFSSFSALPSMFIMIIAMLLIIASFFFVALQVFLTYISFLFVVTIGVLLVPFGIVRQIAWISSSVFSAIIRIGIQMTVLASVVSLSIPVYNTLEFPDPVTWQSAINLLLSAASISYLSWKTPQLASTALTGGTALSAASYIVDHLSGGSSAKTIASGVSSGMEKFTSTMSGKKGVEDVMRAADPNRK